ncbi:MAG: GntR family transcriptional regulator [Deltaproteobacteria bacterium]|nr:GntR family transcriptional regulator [Deltaproteobacteria bacterium]MBW2123172.1 GntR family transcriptional regulator [Deltaproteobacteria bacterium]
MQPEKICELLKEKIIWLDLMPESVLNLSELASSFGVSRTPVKEALIFLQAEGWVSRNEAHFIVTPLSLDRIRGTVEIRSVMEVQSNVWAMYRITPEELALLQEVKKEIMQVSEKASNKYLVQLDVKFHQILFDATKNSQLSQLLKRLLSHYLRFWLSIPREIEPRSFFAETLEIIRAIETKDEPRLRAGSAAHIKNSVDEIMGTF